MKLLATLLIAGVGVLHLAPVAGVTGVASLGRLYGITIESPEIEILLRHRAVLFGMVGGLLLVSAFTPGLQTIALVTGSISTASFLWVARSTGNYGPAIERIVEADILALVALVLAGGCRLYLALFAEK